MENSYGLFPFSKIIAKNWKWAMLLHSLIPECKNAISIGNYYNWNHYLTLSQVNKLNNS